MSKEPAAPGGISQALWITLLYTHPVSVLEVLLACCRRHPVHARASSVRLWPLLQLLKEAGQTQHLMPFCRSGEVTCCVCATGGIVWVCWHLQCACGLAAVRTNV